MFTFCQLLIPETGDESLPKTTLDHIRTQFTHSKVCFETVIRLYYLRNGYEGGNMLLLHCLAVLSFTALADLGSPSSYDVNSSSSFEDSRSTLILTAKGLDDQSKSYFMGATISTVLRGQMAVEDLDILARYCITTGEASRPQEARAQHVKAQYPLNIVKMNTHPESERLETMFKRYEALAIEQAHSATNKNTSSSRDEANGQ